MPRMSLAAYARHRKVSRAAVTYAVQEGRITAHDDPQTGKRYIESDEADRQWEENTEPQRNAPPKKRAKEPRSAAGPSLAQSRAEKEYYLAAQAKLAYEQKLNLLVSAEDVRKEWTRIGRMIRNAILTVPDRLAPLLAGVTDPAKVHELITKELTQSLEAVADAQSED